MWHSKWLTRLTKNRTVIPGFARAVASLVSAAVVGQSLIFLAAPFLTRLYSPEEFGVLSVFSSLLGIAAIIATLRYENAVLIPEREDEAAEVLVLSIVVATIIGGLIALVVLIYGNTAADMFGHPALRRSLWLLPFAVWGAGVFSSFANWSIRAKDYGVLARTNLQKNIIQTAVQVSLGMATQGPIGLILGKSLEKIAGVYPLYRKTRERIGRGITAVTIESILQAARTYKAFPLYSTGASLMRTIAGQMPPLLLALLYGIETAGIYAITQRVLGAPLQMLGNSIGTVYLGHAAELARDDLQALRSLYVHIALRLSVIGAIPALALSFGGGAVFTIVLGPEWAIVGAYVRALAVMYIAQFVVTPLVKTIEIMRRQELRLVWELIQTCAAAVSLTLPYYLSWTPVAALTLYSVTMCIGYLGFFEMNRRLIVGGLSQVYKSVA